jgi:hypothetical protein
MRDLIFGFPPLSRPSIWATNKTLSAAAADALKGAIEGVVLPWSLGVGVEDSYGTSRALG